MKPVSTLLAAVGAAAGLAAAACPASADTHTAVITRDIDEALPRLIFDLYRPDHTVRLQKAHHLKRGAVSRHGRVSRIVHA